MEKRDLIYEGKAKQVYTTNTPDLVIPYFTDDATAGRSCWATKSVSTPAACGTP